MAAEIEKVAEDLGMQCFSSAFNVSAVISGNDERSPHKVHRANS